MHKVALVIEPLEYRMDGGFAYVRITSGKSVAEFGMPVSNLFASHRRAAKRIAEWEAAQRKPVPLRKGAG